MHGHTYIKLQPNIRERKPVVKRDPTVFPFLGGAVG